MRVHLVAPPPLDQGGAGLALTEEVFRGRVAPEVPAALHDESFLFSRDSENLFELQPTPVPQDKKLVVEGGGTCEQRGHVDLPASANLPPRWSRAWGQRGELAQADPLGSSSDVPASSPRCPQARQVLPPCVQRRISNARRPMKRRAGAGSPSAVGPPAFAANDGRDERYGFIGIVLALSPAAFAASARPRASRCPPSGGTFGFISSKNALPAKPRRCRSSHCGGPSGRPSPS